MSKARAQKRRKAAKAAKGKGLPLFPIAIAVVVGLFVVALLVTRGGEDEGTTGAGVKEVQPVTIEGDPLPAFPGEGDDPAVGEPVPELRGKDFSGDVVEITDDGRPKVIMFLAHWCPHCQKEVPLLTGWISENGPPQGVDLYSVATSTSRSQPNYPPSSWLEKEGWPVTVLADNEDYEAADAFGLSGFPFWVFVDADGDVALRAAGELTIEQVEADLDEIRR